MATPRVGAGHDRLTLATRTKADGHGPASRTSKIASSRHWGMWKKGAHIRALVATLALLMVSRLPVAADDFGFVESLLQDETVETQISDTSGNERDDGRRTLKRFPRNLALGFSGPFIKENRKTLWIGGLVTAGSFAFDDTFQSALGREDDNAAQVADDYGGPLVLGIATAGFFAAGRLSNDQKFRDVTYDMATAAIVNIVYTGVLKEAINRDRPNDSGTDSFPSGHTSNAFALASVAAAHYPGKIRYIAYGGATLIGISRLRADAHWLSDILAGATLGILVGKGVVFINNRPLKHEGQARNTYAIAPIFGSGTYGLNVRVGMK